jgi:hypothetical protein
MVLKDVQARALRNKQSLSRRRRLHRRRVQSLSRAATVYLRDAM